MSTITTVGERGKDAVVMEIAEPFPGVHVGRIVEQDDARIERGRWVVYGDAPITIGTNTGPNWSPALGRLCLRGKCVQADHDTFHIGTEDERDRIILGVAQMNRSLRRKRKVQVERWGHCFLDESFNMTCPTRELAEQYVYRLGGFVVRLTGEYEVEE
jgi:hypothetical protein